MKSDETAYQELFEELEKYENKPKLFTEQYLKR